MCPLDLSHQCQSHRLDTDRVKCDVTIRRRRSRILANSRVATFCTRVSHPPCLRKPAKYEMQKKRCCTYVLGGGADARPRRGILIRVFLNKRFCKNQGRLITHLDYKTRCNSLSFNLRLSSRSSGALASFFKLPSRSWQHDYATQRGGRLGPRTHWSTRRSRNREQK